MLTPSKYFHHFFIGGPHSPQLCPPKLKGNTDTSGLVSGLVPIRSSDCGAKFKPGYFLVCIKNCIRILSLIFQDLEDFQSGQELFQSWAKFNISCLDANFIRILNHFYQFWKAFYQVIAILFSSGISTLIQICFRICLQNSNQDLEW